jgi:hypothetical protein
MGKGRRNVRWKEKGKSEGIGVGEEGMKSGKGNSGRRMGTEPDQEWEWDWE